MPFALFSQPEVDNSARTAFNGNPLARLSEKRSSHCVGDALSDDRARIMLMAPPLLLLKGDENGPHDGWFTKEEALARGYDESNAILLGFLDDGAPRLAAPVTLDKENSPAGFTISDFRSTYVKQLVDEATIGMMAQAGALMAWHHSHRFCSRCGNPSTMEDGGYKRVCTSCDAMHFPRTDPVVIMLSVTADNEQCLMGRSPHFPEGVYSCLAGFVEPGESLEDAVRRETIEETGIKVGRVAYHATQPWPFPYSLMIGCYGEALTKNITTDDELEDARWFTRADVRAMMEGTHSQGFVLPPRGAIAWRLIEDWLNA